MNPLSATKTLDTVSSFGTVKPAKSSMDMQTFIQLLTVQLANQNPLDPMKDADFYSQVAALGNVQGLDKLTNASEMGQAAAMIGKTVTAVRTLTDNGENSLVTGVVSKVTVKNNERIITLVDQTNGGLVDVKFGNIQSIGR